MYRTKIVFSNLNSFKRGILVEVEILLHKLLGLEAKVSRDFFGFSVEAGINTRTWIFESDDVKASGSKIMKEEKNGETKSKR